MQQEVRVVLDMVDSMEVYYSREEALERVKMYLEEVKERNSKDWFFKRYGRLGKDDIDRYLGVMNEVKRELENKRVNEEIKEVVNKAKEEESGKKGKGKSKG